MEFWKRTLFLFLVMIVLGSALGKKKTDYSKFVQKVDNIKDFKKLMRTRINVLVVFGSSQSEIDSLMDVFGEAAVQSKGQATLLQVDCSTKEGKKLCKKQKAKPDPTVIQHYKDGEYSADYDRKFSVKSIVAFLKDPTSDGPWEEEDDAQDVVHVHNGNELNKLLKKKKKTLIMFYAPWCGFCKRFKPAFAEAATELKNKVIFAGVDADSPDASELRVEYNVTGFPKTIYFENGKKKFDYSGGHKKDDIVDWLADPQPEKEKEPEKGWDDDENDVIHLTDETFDDFIANNNKVMVFFYAPWCGHCKNLKPHWEEASTTLKNEEAPEKLTAVDATKFNELANRYKVKGYPTIIYFENGEEKYDASGAFTRTADGIVEYIKDPKEPPPPEKEWHEIESDIHHLSDDDFKSATKKKKHALVMFYAPWCGHCKRAKPEYTNAAATFSDDKKVMFGAVDCTKQKKTCDHFSVQGYPTFYYLSYGKSEVKYEGGREESDFTAFIKKVETEGYDDDKKDFWAEFPDTQLLHHLKDKEWESFVAKNSKTLVVVYDPICPNCQALRKPLIELSKDVRKEKMAVEIGLVPVDLKSDGIPNLWSASMGVPTIFWFVNGGKQVEYEDSRSADSMMHFIKKELDDQTPEWSTQDSASDIYHLDEVGFEEFIRQHDEVLVFFHSSSCHVCQLIKPAYEEASTLLDELKSESSMVAVDMRKSPDLKVRYKVTSLPTFLFFRDGKMKFKYHGETTAEAFVDFMLKPSFIKKPKPDDDWFESSNVTNVHEDSLPEFVSKYDNVLVMFYAPWCGHCKKFKPTYGKASNLLKERTSASKLGAFNGNKNQAFNSMYDVKGFPTLVYFRNGKYTSHYKGQRTVDALVDFMQNPDKSMPKESERAGDEEIDIISSTRPVEVELWDPDNFQNKLDESESVMVMFYAPWCGACKKVKTAFFDAAVDIAEDLEDSTMAIFNADKHRAFSKDYIVKGYPTLWYFRLGKKQHRYRGELTKEALVEFMANPQEEREEAGEDVDKATQWIGENDKVKHLSRENLETTLRKYKHSMVFFYINGCEHCLSTLKPKYVEAAKILDEEMSGVVLAAVNGDWEKPLIKKYNVNTFPTYLYFKKGKLEYKYEGPRDATSIVKFMKNPSKDLAKRKKPKSWQDLPDTDYGKVQHLNNKTYDAFLQNHKIAMVMFHSPWYTRCVGPRDEFKLASVKLPEEVGMGAVDCHRMPEQGIICYNLSIKAFPSFKYYKNGELVRDFPGTVADDFVEFLRKEASGLRDEL